MTTFWICGHCWALYTFQVNIISGHFCQSFEFVLENKCLKAKMSFNVNRLLKCGQQMAVLSCGRYEWGKPFTGLFSHKCESEGKCFTVQLMNYYISFIIKKPDRFCVKTTFYYLVQQVVLKSYKTITANYDSLNWTSSHSLFFISFGSQMKGTHWFEPSMEVLMWQLSSPPKNKQAA